MAITAVNLTHDKSDTSVSSYTTASISPTANCLDIVSVFSSVSAVTTPTVTGASGTWVQIATAVDAANSHRITFFRDLSASPGSGALTIDFGGQAQSRGDWSINEFAGVDTSGTNGSGAIVQTVSSINVSTTTTGFTVTLAALGSANNAAHGLERNGTLGAISVGTGLTSLSNDTGTNSVACAEWGINVTAVAWTWASQATQSTAMAVEIKAAAAVRTYIQNPDYTMPDPAW